jgi:crossover junction endodeoxyribonuclease RuvC
MLVVGFDPGSSRFGVGILRQESKKVMYVHSEVIALKGDTFNIKMKMLWDRLQNIYQGHPFQSAAIEEGFLGKNVRSMNILSKVRGVVLGSLLQRDHDLVSYSPRQIKQAVTGNGNAQKSQVNRMVKILLNIKEKALKDDESDALAVAYCHLLNIK